MHKLIIGFLLSLLAVFSTSAQVPAHYCSNTNTWTTAVDCTSSGALLSNANVWTAPQYFDGGEFSKGPNPWADVTRFGGYFGPANPGTTTTGSIASGLNVLTVAAAQDFLNGHGILVLGAGPATALSTPTWGTVSITAWSITANVATFTGANTLVAGQTLTLSGFGTSTFFNGQQVTVNATGLSTSQFQAAFTHANSSATEAGVASGSSITPWGVTGATTYNYCVVAEDYFGGRTTCSAPAVVTNSVATLGVQTATLSSCSRVSGITTCTTTAPHNFTAGAQVNIVRNSTTDPRFEGAFSIFSTPTPTTFTYTQYGAVDATATGGSAQVNATNLVKWQSDPTNTVLRSYIYRCTASCGTPGVGGWVNSLAGIVVGVDGYWQDYGFATTIAGIGNGDVSATAPTTATKDWLSSTILAGSGTTSLTLADNASTTVAGVKVVHDNSPNLAAACASFTRGGIVYIPTSNVATNYFPINSTFKLSSCPSGTQLQINSKIFANAPIVMGSYKNIQGLPGGRDVSVSSPTFYDLRPTALIVGFAYPFIYFPGNAGNGMSIDDMQTQCNQAYQPCIYQDEQTIGSAPTSIRYRHVHANSGSGSNTPWVVKGGFGLFWEYGGWANSSTSFAAPPGMLFSPNCGLANSNQQQSYLVTTQYTYGMNGTVFDACNQPLLGLNNYSFRDMINESGVAPMFRFANTGGVGGFNGNIAWWEIVRPNYADSSGGIATPVIDATMVNIITGLHIVTPGAPQGPLLETNSGGVTGLDVSADFIGIVGAQAYAIPGAGIFANVPAATSGGSGHFAYRMAVPAAVQSAIVSAGGSVPIGAHTYAVTAVDFSGNETTLSPATTATTTTGNQTVTVTLPAAFPTGAKGVNVYRDGNRANNGACGLSPQFTTPGGTYIDTFSFTCGQSSSSVNNAGASLLDANGIAAPTVRISSELLSASPRAEQVVFLPGALTSTWTGASWTLDKAITVTRVQVQVKTVPVTCTPNAVVRLTDGSLAVNVTVSAAANDSGAITQNYAAGAVLTTQVTTAAAGCGTSPADANVVIQYRMQ